MAAAAPAAPTSSSETPSTASDSPQESGGGGWGGFVSRLFGSGETRAAPSAATDQPASKSDEGAGDEGTPAGEQPPKAAAAGTTQPKPATPAASDDDWKPPQTREEFERAVQAENDRREERRKRDEARQVRENATKAQQTRLAQIEAEVDAALADGDSDRARELRAERATILAQIRQGSFVSGLIGGFDQHLLLPLLEPLPQAEQEEIVEAIQSMDPLPGRTHAVKETLKRLEKRWRADEAGKTRQRLKTDEAFLREIRAAMRDEEDEPEHVPGTPSGNGSGDVSKQVNESLRQLINSR